MSDSIQELDQAIKAFESAWELGTVKEFETAIPAAAKRNTDLLIDLACIDLQNRIQRNLDTRVEAYTEAFPQLAEDELVLLELIRTEYMYRPDRDGLDADSYCARFPKHAPQIKMMFQLEFNRSGISHVRDAGIDWRCSSCDAVVPGRDSGVTGCQKCGQPIAIGRYELLERVGQGAFGYVYRARDPKLDREVAVKLPRANHFLMPEESERFLRESRNAAQLDHPGIVSVFDTGRQDGVPYIVSDFIDGKPLSQLLADNEIDFREAAQLVNSIADAVAHAHARGIVHRDLKPSNIMTVGDRDGLELRVMDFGLARRDQTDVNLTIEGQAIGTPAYMSPEQARGDLDEVGPQSDVYSLGVILFQMLCGEVPFRGNVQKLIQQVIHDEPPQPSRFRSRIPRDLETICMKAINRLPSGRYASIQAFRDDLQRWLDDKPILARRISAPGRAWRWCRRRPAVAALLATLAVSIVAGVTGITIQWREAEAARLASDADLGVALESVDRVLAHLGSDTLADIPQAKQLRADVLNDALTFFQRFRQRSPDDPRVAMQVASAHYQVARIQHALGKIEEAKKAYEAATTEYEKLEGRAPDRQKWQLAASAAHSGYASFLLRESDRKVAEEQMRACLELRKHLHDENPESGEFAALFAMARADLGRTLDNIDDAEKEFDAAIMQLKDLVKTKTAIGYKRDLARVLNNYSIKLTNWGKNGPAEKCREEAIALLEDVIADDPNDESKRTLYANCCLQLVKSLREESRLDAARKYQEKAVRAYRNLTEDFPATPRHRERFANALKEVAILASVQHRDEDEAAAHEEAVRQWETLVALFPGKARYQHSLVDDLAKLARALIPLKRNADAENHLRRRLLLQKKLTGDDPQESIRLVLAMRELGTLLADSNLDSKKEEGNQLMSESDQSLAEVDLDQIKASELSNSRKLGLLSTLLKIAQANGNRDEVIKLYLAKIEIYQEGVKLAPENLSRRGGLARQWSYLGKAYYAMRNLPESENAYRTAIQLIEELLKEDPESSQYATQLISFSSSLGHQLYFNGQPAAAASVLQRSLDTAKRLSEERKNEGFRQIRVVLAYIQLGDAIAVQSEDYQGAYEAYHEASKMTHLIREQTGMERFEAVALNSIAWFLVTCPDLSIRDPERALKMSNQAVEISKNNGRHISTLAFALFETGSFEEAIEKFERSSSLDESLIPLNKMLVAAAHAELGRTEKARTLFDEAIELNQANPTEPDLFEVYRERVEAILKGANEERLESQDD